MVGNDVKVSICCLAYNHKPYIRQALDSFLMQETNFKFEILVHDDASTDGTTEIIREYEKKYPDIIKPLYQTENQHSKRVKITWKYQFPRVNGKYIALCEGDDFWCDKKKLQKQFNVLEECAEAVFCAHRVRHISEQGEKLERWYPLKEDMPTGIMKDEWVRKLLSDKKYLPQTSSYFLRTEVISQYCNSIPQFISQAGVGDIPLMLLCATAGDFIFINEEMSCYRTNSKGSWSQRRIQDKDYENKMIERTIEYLEAYNIFTNYRYNDLIVDSCEKKEFILLLNKKQYRTIRQKGYSKFYRTLTIKTKLYYFLINSNPYFEKIYKNYRLMKEKMKKRNG